ncbi:MAG: AAA family ATPase [Bryobacteraceae bacterium]|nr:AAA family ATPase [Bryobacteraceae bacterium]
MALPTPKGRQREVLYLPAKGHVAVLGTAGSGKTTLAILRAVYLSDRKAPHHGRTLLVTFNNTLIAYLKHWAPKLHPDLAVETYHKFARGYLNSRGKMGFNCICEGNLYDALVCQAVTLTKAGSADHPIWKRPQRFFQEEIRWIAQQGIESLPEYEKAERTGRSMPLERKHRPLVYGVVEAYRELRTRSGCKYDWDDVASSVLAELRNDNSPRLYRHVIVDEGQDLSPQMLRSLVAAVPADGSVTFFGDVAQQIYGQRVSWRSAGLKVSDVWRFEENYRNTKQIAALALEIATMPYFQGGPDIVSPKSPTADGALPTLVKCKTPDQEIKLAVEQAKKIAQNRSVAILVRLRKDEEGFKSKLPSGAVRLHRDMKSWKSGSGLFYGTYHSAKGLEFDAVIMPFCDSSRLPVPEDIDALGADEAMAQDGRLLYVGTTRARTSLIVTHSGELTALLPSKPELYQKVSL